MAVQRIKMLNNKKTTGVKLQKKEIAKMIAEGKTEMAAIKVEHIIREDFTIEGYSVLELLCELVHERIKQVTNEKSCPAEMQQAINSLIWAASCVDISELKEIRNQLVKKYGKGYAKIVMENQEVWNQLLC